MKNKQNKTKKPVRSIDELNGRQNTAEKRISKLEQVKRNDLNLKIKRIVVKKVKQSP